MSKITEHLLYQLNRMFTAPPTSFVASAEMQFVHSGRFLNAFEGFVDFRGQDILDIACGTGGITVKIATLGARHITGIDINATSISHGMAFSKAKGKEPVVRFMIGDVSRLPFEDASFDTALTCAGFEHFDDCPTVLKETYRVLRKGGRFLIDFATYPSLWGHHLFGTLNIPFAHILFSEETMIQVAKQVKRENPDAVWTDWLIHNGQGKDYLGGLNKITIAQFEHFIRRSPFEIELIRYVPYKKKYHPLSLISRIDHLRDLNVVYVQCVLSKN
jgi:ubiquinone/menaquinone biosynthesis C-methylase UbiE